MLFVYIIGMNVSLLAQETPLFNIVSVGKTRTHE